MESEPFRSLAGVGKKEKRQPMYACRLSVAWDDPCHPIKYNSKADKEQASDIYCPEGATSAARSRHRRLES